MVIVVLILAAFAMPGQAGSPTLQGRPTSRALGDNPLESAFEALTTQNGAGSQAAASEAGADLGKAVREAAESFTNGTSAPTLSPAATPAAAVHTNSSATQSVQEVRTTLSLPWAQAVRLALHYRHRESMSYAQVSCI